MTVEIRSQKIARAAFFHVEERSRSPHRNTDKYLAFARTFPTLIHNCGLAQAGAFALAKGDEKLQVLDDLSQVMNAADDGWQFENGTALDTIVRHHGTDVWIYMRLTRHALQAATWIKRYAEALLAGGGPAGSVEPADHVASVLEQEGP